MARKQLSEEEQKILDFLEAGEGTSGYPRTDFISGVFKELGTDPLPTIRRLCQYRFMQFHEPSPDFPDGRYVSLPLSHNH